MFFKISLQTSLFQRILIQIRPSRVSFRKECVKRKPDLCAGSVKRPKINQKPNMPSRIMMNTVCHESKCIKWAVAHAAQARQRDARPQVRRKFAGRVAMPPLNSGVERLG
ncbi:hypothetical protein CSC82_03380 [Rhodobacteraceae bacterium 4F10]|nr:hypothetical protein CSC82_03380 [Rhodobacteraceae bacterium 4F10]